MREKFVRNLDEHSGAVAGFRIAAASAAVGQVDEYLDALDDNVVGFITFDTGYEADTAGIMFQAGMIESLRFRQPVAYTKVAHRISPGLG